MAEQVPFCLSIVHESSLAWTDLMKRQVKERRQILGDHDIIKKEIYIGMFVVLV